MNYHSNWRSLVLLAVCGLMLETSFAQTSAPAPFIDSIIPASATQGSNSVPITVSGSGFVTGATIDWNGSALSTTFVSSGSVTATLTSTQLASAQTAALTVVNPQAVPLVGTSNVVSFPVTTSSGSNVFTTRIDFPTGNGPQTVAVGDFNGDGKLDLAVADLDGNTVTISMGNGDGTFTATASSPPTGTSPSSVAVGDFNGDGKLDLAVTNQGDNTLTILLGNGDGTFTPVASRPPTGVSPTSVVVGDFNGDGKLDLAVANHDDVHVTILLGNGDGTFTAVASPSGTNANSVSLVAGDFNRDGKLDLVVANLFTNSLTILLGNGDGTFTMTASSPATSSAPFSVAAGDFNGDGKLDLAAANADNDTLTILLGNGDGTFTAAASPPTGQGPNALAVGDFNGDGNLDVAVANQCGLDNNCGSIGNVTILLGDGTGNFTVTAISPATGHNPPSIVAGDFNGDGRLDFAVTNFPSATLTVLLQTVVELSVNNLNFGTIKVGTTSPSQGVNLTNTGNTTLNISSIGVTGINAGDFGVTNTCGASVVAGGSCTLTATFTPTSTGTRSAAVTIADDASVSPQLIYLVGEGTRAAISLSPTSVNFGSQAINTPSIVKKVTVTSSGAEPLNITNISITGANSGDFTQTNNCPTTGMSPGAKCTITVTFTPTTTGIRTASISMTDDAPNSPQMVALSGTGVPQAVLSAKSLMFGSQAENTISAPKAVTLTNNLNSALTITNIATSGEFTQTNTCGTSVPARGRCTINVTFAPTGTGAQTGTLTVTDNASNSPQTANLTGIGVVQVALSPGSLSFTAQTVGTTSAPKTVTLTNNLSTALAVSGITFTGANLGDFAAPTNTCGTSVPAKHKCTISVTFTPSAIGSRTATLDVNDSADNTPQTVSLGGTGR